MQCLVGIDDTDSASGWCTTYLAFRIAVDLQPKLRVLPYPRLVRLNPNVPFKTRGNAAVCMTIETDDPGQAFGLASAKVRELSDVEGGANSGLVFLDDPSKATELEGLYSDAISGMVNPNRVRRMLRSLGARTLELGNGMGIVGAASSLGFDPKSDHTFELISYRGPGRRGTSRQIESSSVRTMDRRTFPRTFNNYDYQKRKVLIAPHGPDPVFAGVRGESPQTVMDAFGMLEFDEGLEGNMVYLTNQHTDAHLRRPLRWKAYSSGWVDGTVLRIEVGEGGHTYLDLRCGDAVRRAAAYEPTGDLHRVVRLLRKGDRIRAWGGVRRRTSKNPMVLNLEKVEVIFLASARERSLVPGVYIASPRANRHLTKPLVRYGNESHGPPSVVDGWLEAGLRRQRVLAESR